MKISKNKTNSTDVSKLNKDYLVFLNNDNILLGCISNTRVCINGVNLIVVYPLIYNDGRYLFDTNDSVIITEINDKLDAEHYGGVIRISKSDFYDIAVKENFKTMLPINETIPLH